MNLIEELNRQWQEKWEQTGLKEPLPVQTKLIPEMLAGKDAIVQSPTGSGKTLAYVLPVLERINPAQQQLQALIVAPSQELAMQIVNVLRDWTAGTEIGVIQLIGGANTQRQIEKLKKKPAIAVGTPGRLNELVKMKKLKLHEVRSVILDEGDQLLSREHRDVTRRLIETMPADRQIVLVSATVSEEVRLVADRLMNDPAQITVTAEEIPSFGTVSHSFIKVDEREKTDMLRRLSHLQGIKGLAFANSMDQVMMKEAKLQYREAGVTALHSEMKKVERKNALDAFRKGETAILIATDIAARGLDVEGVTHVIHADVPQTAEQYLHRSGRTGRAGADGESLTLLSYKDERPYRKLMKELGIKTEQKIWQRGELIAGSSKTAETRGKKK